MIDKLNNSVLFLKKPKCGGTSIFGSLRDTIGIRNITKDQVGIPDDFVMSLESHQIVKYIYGERYLKHRPRELSDELRAIFNNNLVFCVVRNPWDKLVSGWHMMYHKRGDNMSFNERLKHLPDYTLESTCGEYHHMMQTQMTQITASDGTIIPDRMLRFENLHDEWDELCEDMNWGNIPLRHVGKSVNRSHYRDYYNKESKELVSRLFAEIGRASCRERV